MRRVVIAGIVMAVLTTACGGGDDATRTTGVIGAEDDAGAEASTGLPGAEFYLGLADDGAILRVNVGDTITARLPIDHPSDPPWIVAQPPDPAIWGGGVLLFLCP